MTITVYLPIWYNPKSAVVKLVLPQPSRIIFGEGDIYKKTSRAQGCAKPPKRLLPEGATFQVHFSRQLLALCPTA